MSEASTSTGADVIRSMIATNEAIVIACPERLQGAIGARLSEIPKFLRYRSREGRTGSVPDGARDGREKSRLSRSPRHSSITRALKCRGRET
jgi:hypothetical protein